MSHEKLRPKAPLWTRIIFWSVIFILYIPLVLVAVLAFYDQEQFSIKWFQEVINDHLLMEALFNSILVAIISGFGATILGTAAALALRGKGFVGQKFLLALSFISLMLPEIVFALALLSWFSFIGLELGITTIVLAHITFSVSYVILTVSARLALIDSSVEDAARDLGASEWTLLRQIMLPLLKPALGSAMLLSFLLSFDDFLITFFVSGVESETLPIKLYGALRSGLTPKLNALAIMMWMMSAIVMYLAMRLTVQAPSAKKSVTHGPKL
jgi:spermidine/putrescine transport system permease protein